MQRPSLWLMLVVLLGGLLFLREPRLEKTEEMFLRWLLDHSQLSGPNAPLTVIEIGSEPVMPPEGETPPPRGPQHVGPSAVTPLEFALFLQSALEFKPSVIAFENVLKWRERDKMQEQVFLDQAMRVPRLLLGAELTDQPDPDAPGPDIPGFPHVSGKRADLVEFTGIGRQPGEDARLISTGGFINMPDEIADDLHVPLLFRYRGQVIPSFALEAVLLWLGIAPDEVKIDLGSAIALPDGRKIPIASDGTLLVAPNSAKKASRMSLNDLLVAAQQRDRGETASAQFDTLRDQIVLARTPANPLSPPDVFAATIATMQTNCYLHRISIVFDCIIIILAAAACTMLPRFSRVDLVLGAIAISAAYILIAIATISRALLWLPGVLPLGTLWLLVIAAPMLPRVRRAPSPSAIAAPPPIP